jgi:transposase
MAKGNRLTKATGRHARVAPKTESAAVAMAHPKMSDERKEIVLKGLRLGLSYEVAASYAEISLSCLKIWRKSDEEFGAQCATARAQLEATMLARIEIASQEPKTWQAAAWKLERLWPDQYGRSTRLEVTGKGGGPIEHMDVSKMSTEELRKIVSGEVTTYDSEDI